MEDPHRISSLDEVVALVGEPAPTTAAKIVPDLDAIARRFIALSPFVVLSTADKSGAVSVSPKGDAPGFVRVADDHTLLLPERPGNRLILGYRNMLENPHVGLLFMVPRSDETLRVEGTATLTRDPAILSSLSVRGKPALLAIRVGITRCFFHCGKAFIRSRLWDAGSWPEPFGFRWGAWAKERFGIDDGQAGEVDATIADDEKNNLY